MKIKRIFISTLLLVAISSQAAQANVKVNGLMEPVKYIVESGNSFVGIRDIGALLGVEVTWSTPFRSVTLRKGNDKIVLYVDTDKVEHNGVKSVLPVSCKIIDGSVLVPLRFVTEAFGATVNWDAETSTIFIDTGETLLETKKEVANDTMVLTFEEAYEKTLKNNSDLKSLTDTENLLEETESDLQESMTGITNSSAYLSIFEGMDYTPSEAMYIKQYENIVSTISVARGILSTRKSQQAIEINEQIIKDTLQLSLISLLTQIEVHEMSLAQMEESISISKEKIKNMELKFSLGYESEYNLNTEKNNLKTREVSYEQMKLNYEDTKVSLNKLIGIDANKDVFVLHVSDINDFDKFDLEEYVFLSVNNDLSIKLKKMDLEIADYNLRTNVGYSGESKLEMESKYNSAKRDLEDTKTNLETSIRKTYNDIMRLKQQRQSLTVELEKSKDVYNTTVSNYIVGNVNLLATKEAKTGILNAEINLKSNELDYELLQFKFERPYLLSAK